MREIKFRAWEKEEKEVCTVNLLEAEVGESEFFRVGIVYDNGNSAWRYSNMVELMQYTGLRDKNGKEIYEGDIVQTSNSTAIVEYGIQDIGHDFQGIGFFTRERDGSQYNIYGGDGIAVIGNIYETPELLK